MNHSALSRPTPAAFARWLAHQLAVIVIVALVVAGGLMLVFNQRVVPTLVYCFSITACCSVFVQSIQRGLAALLNRFRAPKQRGQSSEDSNDWPGWPLMIVSLVVGTALGFSVGTEIGNWITGFNESGIHNTSLRRALTIMVISLVPGLAITFYFVGRSRIAQAEAAAQTAQRQAAEHQLRLLEAQLEPHMLFNTLANLRVLIGMDPPRAQAMLDQLIAFLRATLNASRTGSHSLREEFARLSDYLALMQVRMGARLRPELELPPTLAERQVPPLLLQPLIENAIKHGLEPALDGGRLRIAAQVDADGALLLEVEDGGVGLAAAAASGSDGTRFGLQQVRERLATRYGAGATLELSAARGGGTLARIRINAESSA